MSAGPVFWTLFYNSKLFCVIFAVQAKQLNLSAIIHTFSRNPKKSDTYENIGLYDSSALWRVAARTSTGHWSGDPDH